MRRNKVNANKKGLTTCDENTGSFPWKGWRSDDSGQRV